MPKNAATFIKEILNRYCQVMAYDLAPKEFIRKSKPGSIDVSVSAELGELAATSITDFVFKMTVHNIDINSFDSNLLAIVLYAEQYKQRARFYDNYKKQKTQSHEFELIRGIAQFIAVPNVRCACTGPTTLFLEIAKQ